MGLPKLTELYKISRDQFAKSLGSESAVALDLNGEIPALPMVPAPFHDGGRMFRFAYLSDVQDRALLGQSWAGYLKLARDTAQLVPQAAMLPGGIPDATNEVVDGVTLSYYQPSLQTGDLLPNIATTDKTFVMSTSRAYSLALTKAAVKAAAPAKPMSLDFHVNFKPAFDFADHMDGARGAVSQYLLPAATRRKRSSSKSRNPILPAHAERAPSPPGIRHAGLRGKRRPAHVERDHLAEVESWKVRGEKAVPATFGPARAGGDSRGGLGFFSPEETACMERARGCRAPAK